MAVAPQSIDAIRQIIRRLLDQRPVSVRFRKRVLTVTSMDTLAGFLVARLREWVLPVPSSEREEVYRDDYGE